MDEAPLWQALVAGASGGVCNVLIGHPFDTIKVRAQTDRPLLKGSLFTGILGQLVGVAANPRIHRTGASDILPCVRGRAGAAATGIHWAVATAHGRRLRWCR